MRVQLARSSGLVLGRVHLGGPAGDRRDDVERARGDRRARVHDQADALLLQVADGVGLGLPARRDVAVDRQPRPPRSAPRRRRPGRSRPRREVSSLTAVRPGTPATSAPPVLPRCARSITNTMPPATSRTASSITSTLRRGWRSRLSAPNSAVSSGSERSTVVASPPASPERDASITSACSSSWTISLRARVAVRCLLRARGLDDRRERRRDLRPPHPDVRQRVLHVLHRDRHLASPP